MSYSRTGRSLVAVAALVSFAAGFTACSEEAPPAATDSAAEATSDLGDTAIGVDQGAVEVDAADGDATDSSEPDSSEPDGVADADATDAPGDVADDADAGPTTPQVATSGQRCTWANRIGTVEVSLEGPTPSVSAVIASGPNPWYGAPKLETAICEFHAFSNSCGGSCAPSERCSNAGDCVEMATNLEGLRVAVSTKDVPDDVATGETVWFDAEVTGTAWGQIDLLGNTFSTRVTAPGYDIRVEATELPGPLGGLEGTVSGGSEAPTAVDVQWEGHDKGGFVTTLVPINHHAGGPTFTHCVVAADVGALHIDEDMLMPLAVSTGLEFQGVQHVRFAAAQTEAGCVEFRFTRRIYTGLTEVP